MKKFKYGIFIAALLLSVNAFAEDDWTTLPLDVIFGTDMKCTTTECLLDPKLRATAHRQVISQYGGTGAGRCLAGIKRLLSNGLGSEWFTGTRHAADYLPVMRTNATFREVMCDRDRISEYPNGAIFIIDRHPACSLVKGEGMTRTGRKCSVSGHIFIKISDMQEFAGREQNLTRWSTYFGDNCWSFLPSDAKLPDAEPDVNDVCWIDDVSAFQGFDPLEHAQSTIQEMVDQLRRERKEMESLEMRAKDKPNNG